MERRTIIEKVLHEGLNLVKKPRIIIVIRYMTEETDNWGSKKTIRKADVIKRILKDSFLWEDDMLFYDTMGRWWMCDNLIDKYVTVLNDPEREVFMVVDNWNGDTETMNESQNYSAHLKTAAFNKLPFEYQKSIVIYALEGDSIDWTLPDHISINDVARDDKWARVAIANFAAVFGDVEYSYGLIPMEQLTDEIAGLMGFENFEKYHKWYGDPGVDHGDSGVDHGDSVLPILLNYNNDELIEDGWHRFHYYYNRGVKMVPVIVL